MQTYNIEARYEWVKEFAVRADSEREAEEIGARMAKEMLAEKFEDEPPSASEFDVLAVD